MSSEICFYDHRDFSSIDWNKNSLGKWLGLESIPALRSRVWSLCVMCCYWWHPMRKHSRQYCDFQRKFRSRPATWAPVCIFVLSPTACLPISNFTSFHGANCIYRVKNSHGITFELTCVGKRGDCLTAQEKCQKCLMFAANKVYWTWLSNAFLIGLC